MNKELEALLMIYNECVGHTAFCSDSEIKEYCDIIETALKDSEYNFKLAETLGEENEKLLLEQMDNYKKLKALNVIKDLIYVDENNQVRLKPKNKTLTATESLDEEKALLLKEVLL